MTDRPSAQNSTSEKTLSRVSQFLCEGFHTNVGKNDAADAEAIYEAALRPTMRFVPVKSIKQEDLQSLHRARDRVVCIRTASSTICGDCLASTGSSASASRIASGNTDLHEILERELAEFLGAEACVVSVSGHQTNVSTIAYLCGRNDLILHDELVHNSIITGCVLSGARRIPFPHNDYTTLEALLKENRLAYLRVLIVTEGIYSMYGHCARDSTEDSIQGAPNVDEAHSLGVIGACGAVVTEYCQIPPGSIDILMGTLSKTFASCGGFIAGQKELIDMLKYLAPGLVLYSAGISPPNTAAALTALRILREEPQRVQ